MADNEKLNIDIQSKFDISNVEKGVKKLQTDFDGLSNRAQAALKRPKDEFGKFKKAVDDTAVSVNKINHDVVKLGADSSKAIGQQTGMIGQLKNSYMLLGVAIAGVSGTAYKMFEMMTTATKYNEMRSFFKGTENDINNFRKAVFDTVGKGDLIRMSNQMSDLGINLSQQTILFRLAKESGDAYGTSVQDGMQKVLQASNGSERALAKLGISVVTYKNNLAELEKASGTKIELMTVEQQETIKLEALMKSANMTVAEATGGIASQNDEIEAAIINYQELEVAAGQYYANVLKESGLLEDLTSLMNTATVAQNGQNTALGKALSILTQYNPLMLELKGIMGGWSWVGEMLTGKGESLEELKKRIDEEHSLAFEIAEINAKTKKMNAELGITGGTTKGKPLSGGAIRPAGGMTSDLVLPDKDTILDYSASNRAKAEIEAHKIWLESLQAEAMMDEEAMKASVETINNFENEQLDKRAETAKKEIALDKQKWDNIQSIAQQGTDIIGDQLYNAFTGQNVNIERAFKNLLAKMAADFISSGILTLLMRALNPASAGLGLFGALGFASGVEGLQGAGSETSDSIPARLSKGESVLTAGATRAVQQSMGEGWITNLNKQYARSRSNMAIGTFAGGIESLPSRGAQTIVVREIGDVYLDSQVLDKAIRDRGSVKNNRRYS